GRPLPRLANTDSLGLAAALVGDEHPPSTFPLSDVDGHYFPPFLGFRESTVSNPSMTRVRRSVRSSRARCLAFSHRGSASSRLVRITASASFLGLPLGDMKCM